MAATCSQSLNSQKGLQIIHKHSRCTLQILRLPRASPVGRHVWTETHRTRRFSWRPFCVHALLSLHWPELWKASGNYWIVSAYSESTHALQYLLQGRSFLFPQNSTIPFSNASSAARTHARVKYPLRSLHIRIAVRFTDSKPGALDSLRNKEKTCIELKV